MTTLEKTLRWIAIAGVFALPFVVFIVARSLFFPFITGKNFTFRIVVELATGAWLALALVNTAYRPKRSWLLGAFALFVAVMALADALGAYPFKSFWSNFERMDGWVTLAHLLALLVVSVSVLNTEKLWRAFWRTSIVVSVLVGLYGLLQLAGVSALGQGGAGGLAARLDATFGNPIYLAAYMLFHVFFAALFLFHEWSGGGRRWTPWTVLYVGAIVLDTLILFFTGTRGTMLGLIGGVVVAALLYALATGSSRTWRRVGISLAVLVVAGGGVWLARDSAFVQKIGFLNRLSTISISDPTIKSRFLNAGMAFEGFKERPILGWGQENYAIVFDKYYDPQMYAQEQWFDRVHNTVLDWLVAGGLLGLLSYLSIFACALWCLFRKEVFSAGERSILAGLLAAYFFHNLFVFDNITSYILFTATLGYILFRASHSNAPLLSGLRLSPSLLPVAAIAIAILVWGVVWAANARALAANRALIQAITPQQEGIEKNLEYFKKSIAFGTYGMQEAREQLVQGAVSLAGRGDVAAETKQRFVETALSEMKLQADASPLDARFPLFAGVLLDAYGDFTNASPLLVKAHELSPDKQSILYEIASNQFALGRTSDALATFKQAFELAPENREARMYYAALLIRLGQESAAGELIEPLVESGAAADSRIAAAYVSRGNYGAIVRIWEAHVKAQPKDAQGYFTLAAAYFEQGNSARAISVLEEAGRAIPDAKQQADALIGEVRSGKASL